MRVTQIEVRSAESKYKTSWPHQLVDHILMAIRISIRIQGFWIPNTRSDPGMF